MVALSAISGQGIDHLYTTLEIRLSEHTSQFTLVLKGEQGADIHWLYENCDVLTREDREDGSVALNVRVPAVKLAQMKRRFSDQFAQDVDAAE